MIFELARRFVIQQTSNAPARAWSRPLELPPGNSMLLQAVATTLNGTAPSASAIVETSNDRMNWSDQTPGIAPIAAVGVNQVALPLLREKRADRFVRIRVELTSAVNNPDRSDLAEDFLEFVQRPEIAERVAFAEGTYNPVAQMGNPEVLARFDADMLDAIQYDSLEEDMSRCHEFDAVPSYDALLATYVAARRG